MAKRVSYEGDMRAVELSDGRKYASPHKGELIFEYQKGTLFIKFTLWELEVSHIDSGAPVFSWGEEVSGDRMYELSQVIAVPGEELRFNTLETLDLIDEISNGCIKLKKIGVYGRFGRGGFNQDDYMALAVGFTNTHEKIITEALDDITRVYLNKIPQIAPEEN